VSQLGFMFLGVGVGAFTAGFFHVFTHAFFKACLFLGSGSVIHAMHGRIHDDVKSQDIRNMGGLYKYMPITFWTFAAATAAIIGFPFTSGFFSKDEILYKVFVNKTLHPFRESFTKRGIEFFSPPAWLGTALYVIAVLAATMTAFYMCRLLFLTFFGTFRGWTVGRPSALAKSAHDDHGHAGEHHEEDLTVPGYAPHESPWQMTVPLIILGTASIVAGILNAGLLHFEPLGNWLDPVFETATKAGVVDGDPEHHKVWSLAAPGMAAFAIGSALAYWMYIVQKGEPAKKIADASPALYRLVYDKWRIDELYDNTVIAAVESLAETSAAFDKYVVDGIIARASSAVVQGLGVFLRSFQNGVVHVYGAIMVIGLVFVGWFFVAPHADVTVNESNGDYTVEAAPGVAYAYRWDADGNGKPDTDAFGNQTQVKVHLEPGASQVVRLEVKNAFGLLGAKEIPLARPQASAMKVIEVGQN
jgi:NADH-quinone oxidoreductase subunit L